MDIKLLSIPTLAFALLLSACGKSDAELTKAVTDKLAADKVAGVTATVKDGVAKLTGEVADVTVKNKAEVSVKSVEGVKSVDNQLKPLPSPLPAPADPMLKVKLEEALRKAGCTGATVTVADGKVTLGGTVPDAKFAVCVRVAEEAGGSGVQNQLVKEK